MTDNEILEAVACCRLRFCSECPRFHCEPRIEDECRINLMSDVFDLIKIKNNIIADGAALVAQYKHDQEKLIAERDQARRDCAVAPFFIKAENIDIPEDMRKTLRLGGIMVMPSAEPSIEIIPTIDDFKTALLKKIFPYDAVDKKQYSINAYAVERAILEVAEEMMGGT